MAKKVVVLTFPSDASEENSDALEGTQETLRTLRGLGVRFSTEIVEEGETTLTAWLEEKEPRVKKERPALERTIPAPEPAE